MSFDIEGWTILFFKVCDYKNSHFCRYGYKNIQLIYPVSNEVLIKIRIEIL